MKSLSILFPELNQGQAQMLKRLINEAVVNELENIYWAVDDVELRRRGQYDAQEAIETRLKELQNDPSQHKSERRKQDVELAYSDLIQLVRKEYSNERDNIDYNRAARVVDGAIKEVVDKSIREAVFDELETFAYRITSMNATDNWLIKDLSKRLGELAARLEHELAKEGGDESQH